jgi:rhodanese-related sulfurtransferase
MELIERDELKAKLDRADDFKLVMMLNEWAYNAMHISGSINIFTPDKAKDELDPDDEIVVYCSNEACMASVIGYQALKDAGYEHVRRYAGGLVDWQEAGYPLDGERARKS